MALLLDIGPVDCACTDHALEALYKALGDPPDDKGIWTPHHSPWVRETIEQTTRRGQRWLAAVQNALLHLFGLTPQPLAKADGPWRRWTPAEIEAVRQLLAERDPDAFTFADWMQVVDWIIQRYLPEEVIASDAEYMAVRSVLAGRVEASMPGKHDAAAVAATLPATRAAAAQAMTLTARDEQAIDYAAAHAAEHITEIGDAARHRIRTIVFEHENQKALRNPEATPWKLEQRLLDTFGSLNRDWRRVAVTEIGENQAQGQIASLAPGARVRRVEVYGTACPWCRSINGKVMTVVDPSKPDKDGATEVWAGKTNVGRSASPRKRVGDELIERTPEELYWVAAGLQHPMCRGSWDPLTPPAAGVDPKFQKFLDDLEREHAMPPPPDNPNG